MNEPVGIQQDDDVTVLNRPAAEALYRPRHTSAHDTIDDEIWSLAVLVHFSIWYDYFGYN